MSTYLHHVLHHFGAHSLLFQCPILDRRRVHAELVHTPLVVLFGDPLQAVIQVVHGDLLLPQLLFDLVLRRGQRVRLSDHLVALGLYLQQIQIRCCREA